MRNQILVAVLLIFPIFALTPCAFSTNYYVNGSTGNDSYNGFYETYQGGSNGPWRTIGKVASTVPSGSHRINVAGGTYSERVTVTASGTDSNNLLHYKANGTVICYGFQLEGNNIKVEGFVCASPFCDRAKGIGIRILGNYCVALNNTIQDCPAPGITLESTANNCTVSGNTIVRCGVNGLSVRGGSNHLIENNDISDIRAKIGSCLLIPEANGVEFHGVGHTFRGNYVHDIVFANQSGYSPHIDAFQSWDDGPPVGPASNCTIERNHVRLMEEAQGGYVTVYGFMLRDAKNLTIKNNIIESWGGINTAPGGNSNLKIYNNTFRSSLSFARSYWPMGIVLEDIDTVQVYNNITFDFSYAHYKISGASGIIRDYNCAFNSDGSTPRIDGASPALHDLWGQDALFVSEFTDLHLQSNSPSINAGKTLAEVTDDFDGKTRPQGAAFDIGAYEYKPNISRPMGLRIVN
jgi:parallel beta-helix repeat protein